MKARQMNRTRSDEVRVRQMVGNEAMVGDEVEGDGVVDVELLRRAHLSAMLTELVRREGPTKAAQMLGVSYKTVARAQKSGKITAHLSTALERLLELADDPDDGLQRGRMDALEESVKRLEDGMESLAKELRDGLAGVMDAVVKGGGPHPGGEHLSPVGDEADRSGTGAAPPVVGLRSKRRSMSRRIDPEIVTVSPADDDDEVYGAAWPLVDEWRGLRADHPYHGKSLSWLTTHERLLVLELAMLEEHGLTLPPEKEPLRGFGRRGQTSWRWTALDDTRRALRRRRLLRWVRRVLTLGLWWR